MRSAWAPRASATRSLEDVEFDADLAVPSARAPPPKPGVAAAARVLGSAVRGAAHETAAASARDLGRAGREARSTLASVREIDDGATMEKALAAVPWEIGRSLWRTRTGALVVLVVALCTFAWTWHVLAQRYARASCIATAHAHGTCGAVLGDMACLSRPHAPVALDARHVTVVAREGPFETRSEVHPLCAPLRAVVSSRPRTLVLRGGAAVTNAPPGATVPLRDGDLLFEGADAACMDWMLEMHANPARFGCA
jgi:hypothetical protein